MGVEVATAADDGCVSPASAWNGSQQAGSVPKRVSLILAKLRCNIDAAVAGDNVCEIATRTGIDLRRVLQIIGGDTPDGNELRRFETAYRTALWPRFDSDLPRDVPDA